MDNKNVKIMEIPLAMKKFAMEELIEIPPANSK